MAEIIDASFEDLSVGTPMSLALRNVAVPGSEERKSGVQVAPRPRRCSMTPGRKVTVAGVGLHPFGRFGNKDLATLAREAVLEALKDSGVPWKSIPVAYFGHVYYHGMSVGETALSPPSVSPAFPSSTSKTPAPAAPPPSGRPTGASPAASTTSPSPSAPNSCPRGPVTVTAEDSPDRFIGGDHMMAGYALRARRYMEETGAPPQALAQVSVKARNNASLNPYAHRTETYTQEQVLRSRPIADPLTLLQCCPTSEGAAAAVLCAVDALDRYGIDRSRAVTVSAAVLTSGSFNGRGSDHSAFSPYRTEPGAEKAYEMAGLGPEDVDLTQVHDAATIGELQQIESLQLTGPGEAWRATLDGRTEIIGDIPVNTDGGLLAMGHPFGATGIRQVHETILQLRGEAGPRQVPNAKVGVAQCSGAGDVTTVHIFTK